ncbi:MAG: hypothetical protein HUU35_02335, partial [Armatimonadetes bacterium]|nr:hypothetical protein [Armatimonadota bacterium]
EFFYQNMPAVDPLCMQSGQPAWVVCRGGDWLSDLWRLRPSDREGYKNGYRDKNIGFRTAARGD